ncbi:MAG: aminotransferase [Bacteroidetes bacterium HGW-Bacteroidetes-17]|nr:MAG: aminotransferase [Bacteroidetes bacterium HGW-Bacteroidetes-17]
MTQIKRRNFLKASITGFAGAAMFSAFGKNVSSLPFDNLSAFLSSENNDENYWEQIKEQFPFAEGLKYFNNGSLGPSPLIVREASCNFRTTLDEFPSKYMWGGWKEEVEKVRSQSAELLSVSPEEIALIHNTTEGFNMLAKSFDLKAGDEIILADHEHTSVTIPWQVWQESKGIKLVQIVLPILPDSVEEIVEMYRKAITPKTKIISICHLLNTNGMILPIKELSEMAHQKGIYVAVDGAQAAGMFDINLKDLGCDYYAASTHKWLFSPKEIGIFYARKESQHLLKPLIVANGHKDLTIRRLENYNTRNLPDVLGLGTAIEFHNSIGREKIEKRSYELKAYLREKIGDNPKFKFKSPANDELSAAIQTLEIVGKDVNLVKAQLFENYGIDTRPMTGFGLNGLRISLAIYITKHDIDDLVDSLEEIAG